MKKRTITPDQALENLFSVIKEAAESNPAFSNRLFNAVGQPVEYIGKDAVKAMDPCILAARKRNLAEFKKALDTFSERELITLAKDHQLATKEQLEKAKKEKEKKDKYMELIWFGARRRLEPLGTTLALT